MGKVYVVLVGLSLIMAAGMTLSCGSTPSSSRMLRSVTLNPATAEAQDYSAGKVQFVATGFYSSAPLVVTPISADWGTCYQGAVTNEITVSSAGLAQCTSGAAGTYTVWAEDLPMSGGGCLATTPCGGGCFVVGSAQLTCP